MSKVRVNFYLPKSYYDMVQDIADNELTSSADIFRKAIKDYIYNYKNRDINKFFNENKQLIAKGNTDGK